MTVEDNFTGPTDVGRGHDEFLAWVRQVKQRVVLDHPDDPDLGPAIRVQGRTPFDWEAVALVDEINRDKGLFAASVLCTLLRPDSVTMVADAFVMTGDGKNPATGEFWGPGELGQWFAAGNRDGLVGEALTFQTVFRDGRHRLEQSRYRVTPTGLAWVRSDHDVLDTGEEGATCEVSGVIPEHLVEVLTTPHPTLEAITQIFVEAGLEPERAHVHRMMAAAQILRNNGITTMLGGDHPFLRERAEQDGEAVVLEGSQEPNLDPTLFE